MLFFDAGGKIGGGVSATGASSAPNHQPAARSAALHAAPAMCTSSASTPPFNLSSPVSDNSQGQHLASGAGVGKAGSSGASFMKPPGSEVPPTAAVFDEQRLVSEILVLQRQLTSSSGRGSSADVLAASAVGEAQGQGGGAGSYAQRRTADVAALVARVRKKEVGP